MVASEYELPCSHLKIASSFNLVELPKSVRIIGITTFLSREALLAPNTFTPLG